MKESLTVESLEAKKNELIQKHLPKEILKQIDTIQATIDIFRAETKKSQNVENLQARTDLISLDSGKSTQEEVINITLDLIDKNPKSKTTSAEILDFLNENRQDIVNQWKDRSTRLGSILYTESERKKARIRRAGRGTWRRKDEKHANNLTV